MHTALLYSVVVTGKMKLKRLKLLKVYKLCFFIMEEEEKRLF